MKQIELDKLQQKLEEFGAKLTPALLEEFRQIIFSIGTFHNSVGDIYKYAEIALLPRTSVAATDTLNIYNCKGEINQELIKQSTPTYKKKVDNLTDLAMTLARNLELNLKKE